jgi:ribose 5-phosphate isomerase B
MLYLATDHRGFALKEKIKAWLTEWGVEYQDLGATTLDADDDYPDYVHAAARKVAEDPTTNRAIILGGSGQGEAMTANRYKGVRAAVYYGGPEEITAIARVHNDANVLSIGAAPGININESKALDDGSAQRAVQLWLNTPYSHDERHARRIAKIDQVHSE